MWELHAVIISKPISLDKAKSLAQQFIKDKSKTFYRETEQSYRMRNIAKTKFSEFRTKVIDKKVSLIYGKLK